MRKPAVVIAIGILCCAILAGCGKTENNAQPSDNTDAISGNVTDKESAEPDNADPESDNTADRRDVG